MWMGDNAIMPARVLSTGEPLKDVLYANKEELFGTTVLDKFGPDLPFLPKVRPPHNLSITSRLKIRPRSYPQAKLSPSNSTQTSL